MRNLPSFIVSDFSTNRLGKIKHCGDSLSNERGRDDGSTLELAYVLLVLDRQNGREQLDSPAALPTPEPTQQAASCQSVAVAALQEETAALRAEIASLQAQLANFKNQASNQRQQAGSESPRRESRVGSNRAYLSQSYNSAAISLFLALRGVLL